MRSPFLALALGAASFAAAPLALAQQSLFNVPAGDLARPGRAFVQLQSNVAPGRSEASLTADVGVTPFLELGCNVNHVTLYDDGSNGPGDEAPAAVTGNASVLVRPTAWLNLSAGTQLGSSWRTERHRASLVLEGWLVARASAFHERLHLVAGGYAGTRAALGAGDSGGALLGAEVVILPERLTFMADWVIGLNSASVAVPGLVVTLPGGLLASAGAQLPSPGSGNGYGAVFELTYGG